jgi:hypothetical protein
MEQLWQQYYPLSSFVAFLINIFIQTPPLPDQQNHILLAYQLKQQVPLLGFALVQTYAVPAAIFKRKPLLSHDQTVRHRLLHKNEM